MTDPFVIVGSGASGVHFAQTALEAGRRVVMLDVGWPRTPSVLPDADLAGLKAQLEDPVQYFLGDDWRSLILPGADGEYYGFPPSKEYVFRELNGFAPVAQGFSPLFSFAAGGLAEVWTGGSYPLNDAELEAFPFGYEELGPYYAQVARRVGISGEADDLARFFPEHEGLQPPLDLDEHSRRLMAAYGKKKVRLQQQHRFFMGRARTATLSQDLGDRKACSYLARCLWGCPRGSLYTPSLSLRAFAERDSFAYHPNMHVSHFVFGDDGAVRKVVARSTEDGREHSFDVGTLVLAAGALCSSKIVLDSIYRDSGEVRELGGLTDNRQILMPFVNIGMVGRRYARESYQYHQLAMAIDADDPAHYVHGLVTTLKTALIHPVVQSIPSSLGTAARFFRGVRAGLGLVNINFADWRRDENRVGIEVTGRDEPTTMRIHYEPASGEPERMAAAVSTFRKVLRSLGCIAPKGMTHQRPMGASVHYSGTMPMMQSPESLATDTFGKVADFENLYVVDGATFPSLPAKNLTFTLMANAARIADRIVR